MLSQAKLVLVADLVQPERVDRMPEGNATVTLLGIEVPRLCLAPFEGSAPIKLALAIARAARTSRDR
jgi:HPr kinase/phosphorylase